MPSDLATIVLAAQTDWVPHEVSQAYVDHTKRGEVMEFVGLLRLDLAAAGIRPKSIKKSVVGVSTGSGEASVEIDVAVTADKDKLFELIRDPKFQEKYLDVSDKQELDELFLSWGLEDPDRSGQIVARVRKENLNHFAADIVDPVNSLLDLVGDDVEKLEMLNVAIENSFRDLMAKRNSISQDKGKLVASRSTAPEISLF